MFIKNLATGMIHEVLNKDVIRQCSKDKNYIVADSPEEFEGKMEKTTDESTNSTGTGGEPDENSDQEEDIPPQEEDIPSHEEECKDYSEKSLTELREIAKDKGIQGYKNMNKETLIAVIEAH